MMKHYRTRPECLENFEKTQIDHFKKEPQDPLDKLYFNAFYDDLFAISQGQSFPKRKQLNHEIEKDRANGWGTLDPAILH